MFVFVVVVVVFFFFFFLKVLIGVVGFVGLGNDGLV